MKVRKPTAEKIRLKDSPTLYEIEDQLFAKIKEQATEIGRVLGFTDVYKESIPEALYTILDNYEKEVSIAVCEAFLANHKK